MLEYIVDKAVEYKLGARGLRSICEAVMLDAMYDTPDKKDLKELKITLDYAMKKFKASEMGHLKAA